MKVLIRMSHGLGDGVQFGIVIKHLTHYFPEWIITVESPPGMQDLYSNLGVESIVERYPLRQWEYDQTFYLHWQKAEKCYKGIPSTKVARCLDEIFQLEPIEPFFYYSVNVSLAQRKRVDEFIEVNANGRRYAVIHWRGDPEGSPERKDLAQGDVSNLCDTLIKHDWLPVILDWGIDPLSNDETILNPKWLWGGQSRGDAGQIAALIQRAGLCFAVDSGPGHLAAAVEVSGECKTYIIWREYHPVHNFDLSLNTTHIVNEHVAWHLQDGWQPGDEYDYGWQPGQAYFDKMYPHIAYSDDDWLTALLPEIAKA